MLIFFFGEDGVDGGEDSGAVVMGVQQAMLAGMFGQRDFGKIDGGERRAVVAVLDEFFGDFDADVLLRLLGAAADVRRQDHVFHAAQRRDELVAVGFGLDGKNVDGGAGKMLRSERGGQRVDIDHGAARRR